MQCFWKQLFFIEHLWWLLLSSNLIQWNLLIVDILYSRNLSTMDTFLRNGWNDGHILISKPQCSRHFIADTSIAGIIFRSQLSLPLIIDLYCGHIQCKTFLARNLYTFYIGQWFIVLFKVSWIFVISLFSQFNGLFRSMEI